MALSGWLPLRMCLDLMEFRVLSGFAPEISLHLVEEKQQPYIAMYLKDSEVEDTQTMHFQ